MKKIVLSFILFFSSILFVSADTLTITYDANDGSGRTKVVEVEKGDSYVLAGNDIFDHFNDDKDDPMDDEVITRWTMNPDNSDLVGSVFYTIERYHNTGEINSRWEFFNNEDEVTLYAEWDKREDLSDRLTVTSITGEGVVQDENGEYSILDYKDFTYKVSFAEVYGNQIGQLSYFRLPKYFTDALPFYIKEVAEEPLPLEITITSGALVFYYYGSYYIKNDILYIDLIKNDSEESTRLYACNNLRMNFKYDLKWKKKYVNDRWIYSVTVSFMDDSPRDPIEVDQKGKITVQYIDIDTGESLLSDETSAEVIGVQYIPKLMDIDNYELVETPENKDYYYDVETQVLYFKYKKKTDEKNTSLTNDKKDIQKNPNTGNKIPVVIMLVSFIVVMFSYFLKLKKCD